MEIYMTLLLSLEHTVWKHCFQIPPVTHTCPQPNEAFKSN